MKSRLIALVVSTGLLTAGTAYADHNSKNGEGWANMPNDIHNTRIETREAAARPRNVAAAARVAAGADLVHRTLRSTLTTGVGR